MLKILFLTLSLLVFCPCCNSDTKSGIDLTESKKTALADLTERYRKFQIILASKSVNLTANFDSLLKWDEQKSEPYIVETYNFCPETSCHQILLEHFTSDNHIILDHRNAVIFTSLRGLLEFKRRHTLVVVDHLRLLPIFKIQNQLLTLNHLGSVKKIRVLVFKMRSAQFLHFAEQLSNLEVDMDSPAQCQGVCVAIVSLYKDSDLQNVLNILSSREEVFWIEPVHEVILIANFRCDEMVF